MEIEKRRPELRDQLASAIELEQLSKTASGMERSLATLATARYAAVSKINLLRGHTNRREISRLALIHSILAATVVGAIALNPADSRIAAVRAAAPWAGAQWPKRTGVLDATWIEQHPRGEPVSLKAALMHSNRSIENTDVTVRVRLLQDGQIVSRTRLLSSWQRRKIGIRAHDTTGELFEVLANTDGDMLEYRFETLDDHTPWAQIALIERPSVVSATAEIRRPDYVIATSPNEEPNAIQHDLGTGQDERASAPASLGGSAISLLLTLNKPLSIQPDVPGWISGTLGVPEESVRLSSESDTSWRIDFELSETTLFRVALTDELGVTAADTAVFRFPAEQDSPPAVVVTDPAFDDTALQQAVISLAANAQDDVALASLWSSAQRFEPDGAEPSGRSGATRPVSEPIILDRAAVRAGDRRAEMEGRVDFTTLGARAGDEIHLWATAVDVYAYETGLREPTLSAVRRIFIVSEDEFVEDVRAVLSGIRRESIRLFESQHKLAGSVQHGEAQSEDVRREQSTITRDIERQAERARSLLEQIRTNRLDDEALMSLTRDAAQLAASAGESSQNAADAVQQEGANPDQKRDNVERAQERTLDDLGELIALLDSGEDAWSARRDLEQLLESQRENLEATRKLGQETAGLNPEDLNEQQQSELERITDRQNELAQQARSATQGLRETQEKLKENDPAASSALAEAAQSLEQSEVSQSMQEAAEQAQENRTSRSASLQQEAIEQLQEALERLDNAEKARDEQLRRLARSLVETIEGLIESQTAEIAKLNAGDLRARDGMINLHTRTIAAAEMARAERELRPVARPLDDASVAQLDAITALGAPLIDAEVVRTAEQRSFDALRAALEEAQRLQEQIEQEATDRERDELKQAYAQALKAQTELRDSTRAAAPDANPDRRTRAELRRLAAVQSDITSVIRDLEATTEELEDAVVFRFVHKNLQRRAPNSQSRARRIFCT